MSQAMHGIGMEELTIVTTIPTDHLLIRQVYLLIGSHISKKLFLYNCVFFL